MRLFFPFLMILLLLASPGCSTNGTEFNNDDSNSDDTTTRKPLETDLPLDKIKLPEGFSIELFAKDVDGARSMVWHEDRILFVGSRNEGNVYALPDKNNDQIADEVIVIASGLNSPNGVALKNGDLYVAEIGRILKFPNIAQNYNNNPRYQVVTDVYPEEGHHGWKFISFGPDGKLYVPVGAPCNICESDSIFSTITRINDDGSELEIYAKGIRNTVGFDWHPETGDLWFTDNGRDWLGDNSPNDELNRAPEKGMHFGYPYCHAGTISDPDFGSKHKCSEFTAPVQNLGPHVAALGMRFYEGSMFPSEFKNQIFIAEHGSWNRSSPIGYRVQLVRLNSNLTTSYETFAEGWLQGGKDWGRPVDVQELPDGSLLVSDDKADVIYRISYR